MGLVLGFGTGTGTGTWNVIMIIMVMNVLYSPLVRARAGGWMGLG